MSEMSFSFYYKSIKGVGYSETKYGKTKRLGVSRQLIL